MTGSDVVKELHVPFPHRWIRFHVFRTDSSHAVTYTDLDFKIERAVGGTFPVRFREVLFKEINMTDYYFSEVFGEGHEYENSTWQITMNGTNTNLLYPMFYVQRISG